MQGMKQGRIASIFSATPGLLLGGLVLSLSLLSGCSGITVYTDYDPSLDFSQYQSYAWMPEEEPETGDYRIDNDLIRNRVRSAVDNQLQAAGFRLVSEEEASFLVIYRVALQDKTQISSSGGSITYGSWGRGRYGSVGYGTGIDSYDYTQGFLILDIMDPKSKELVWRGTAERRVDEKKSPEKADSRINQAYAKILERFPPGKSTKK